MNREQYLLLIIRRQLDERIKQHSDNLEMWQEPNGHLVPTEPDPEERSAVRRELAACITELTLILQTVKECKEVANADR